MKTAPAEVLFWESANGLDSMISVKPSESKSAESKFDSSTSFAEM